MNPTQRFKDRLEGVLCYSRSVPRVVPETYTVLVEVVGFVGVSEVRVVVEFNEESNSQSKTSKRTQ